MCVSRGSSAGGPFYDLLGCLSLKAFRREKARSRRPISSDSIASACNGAATHLLPIYLSLAIGRKPG